MEKGDHLGAFITVQMQAHQGWDQGVRQQRWGELSGFDIGWEDEGQKEVKVLPRGLPRAPGPRAWPFVGMRDVRRGSRFCENGGFSCGRAGSRVTPRYADVTGRRPAAVRHRSGGQEGGADRR